MRILVIIYEFPPVGGGGGQAAKDICLGLVKRGHDVHVLTSHIHGLPYRENIDGLQVIRVPSARRLAYQADLLAMSGFVMAGLSASLRHMRSWRPEVIHVHFAVPSGPVAWAIHRLTGIPYVLTAHLGDVPGGVPQKTDQWFRWIYAFTPPIWREAHQAVAVSQFTRQLAARHYDVDIKVIHNGVDLICCNPGEIQLCDPPHIIFAGRFTPQKNLMLLVQTLDKLKHLDWKCTMLGDGPQRPDIEAAVKALGLQDRFTFPGWITPQEVVQWLAESDILFMPSLSEGFPVVGLQSLAMGLSIVATQVGGFIDLIESGKNGYLIEHPDENCFAQALESLLTDPERLYSFREASRQKALQFDINRVVEAYEGLFLTATQA